LLNLSFLTEATYIQDVNVSSNKVQQVLPVLFVIKKEFKPNSKIQTFRHWEDQNYRLKTVNNTLPCVTFKIKL